MGGKGTMHALRCPWQHQAPRHLQRLERAECPMHTQPGRKGGELGEVELPLPVLEERFIALFFSAVAALT